MQLAAAGTGVFVSDGSTNVLPIGDRDAVHAAWRLHCRLVRRSLARGIYQGWDMHPAQLPTRFVATYLFYREGLRDSGRPVARVPRPGRVRLPRRARNGRGPGRLRPARPRLRCGRPGGGRQAHRRRHRGTREVGPPPAAIGALASRLCDWLRSSPRNPSTSKERRPLTPRKRCERRRKPAWSATSARWARWCAASRSCSCPHCPACWRAAFAGGASQVTLQVRRDA